MQELLTREERDRLAERLLPGEKILWQGKSRCGWWRRAAKEWKGMLFSVFFAAAWGWGCCIAASAPVWTGEVMFALAVMGICCFFGIALLGMLLINAVLETRRANAVLHALNEYAPVVPGAVRGRQRRPVPAVERGGTAENPPCCPSGRAGRSGIPLPVPAKRKTGAARLARASRSGSGL